MNTGDLPARATGGGPTQGPWVSGFTVGVSPGLEPRILRPGLRGRENRAAYVEAGGYADAGVRGEELIDAVESAGLRGRGGAAFPAGVKMRAVRDRGGPRYLVANGEEGEPAPVKDRWLLRFRPHLMLDGLLRTAEAVGVERAYVFVSDATAVESVGRAIQELTTLPVPIDLVAVAPTYVAGEEKAVVRALGGGPALPVDKPPRPFEAGVGGGPTLVANVETLANVPFVAVEGAAAYRRIGTARSPGSFLATVSGNCRRSRLYEVSLGAAVRDVLDMPEAPVGEVPAVLIGGFIGGILGTRALDMSLAHDELREGGSGLGCGAAVVLGEDDCPVAAVADLVSYFARESANQCGTCIRGTPAMRDAVFALARGTDDTARVRSWSVSVRERGRRAPLDGAAGVAASLLREFPKLVEKHLAAPCSRCARLIGAEIPETTRFRVQIDEHYERGEPVT